jgi:hypothetical protein
MDDSPDEAASRASDRLLQAVLIVSTLGFSWLAMMAVHELGHVLHLWATGGEVAHVVLHPLEFSRTDAATNPRPLAVAWGGAVWGCIIPLAIWGVATRVARQYSWLSAFFAGFCLIANGAYLAGGSFIAAGDAGDLLAHGAARWQLLLFGIPAVIGGLTLWNGLGPKFGLGASAGRVDRRAAIGMSAALIISAGAAWIFG